MARNQTKLTNLLLHKGLSESTISSLLTIVQGDIRDTVAVSQVLAHNNATASIIVSGIGTRPTFLNPVTICADATKSIFTAIRDLKPTRKPIFISISTTGITTGPRDVPLLFLPLYHVLLFQPHADKRVTEKLILDETAKSDESVIGNYVIVRPSLLTDGPALGMGKIREGTNNKPAVGYTISRDDVGSWIFESIIDGGDEGRKRTGKMVTITY